MNSVLKEMSVNGQYASLSHGRVRYELGGPEGGESVVLVHGLIGHLHIWDRNFDTLVAQGYRVLRMDLYGRGFSERVKHPHTAQLFVSQLDELLQHVDMKEPLHLIGLSMGGAVITRFAAAFPQKVRSMLWVDSYAFPRPKDVLSGIMRSPGIGEALIGTLGGPILRRAPDRGVYQPHLHRDFNRWFSAPLNLTGSKRALLSTLRNFMAEDHSPYFEKANAMDIPKLLVWGQYDRVLPFNYGERVRQLLPSARFEVFTSSGHLPHFEEPETFNTLAIEFLKTR